LLEAANQNNPSLAEEVTRQVMSDSIHYWELAEKNTAQ
jgi:hypothetical protein